MDFYLGIALYALLSGKIHCERVIEAVTIPERPAIAFLPSTFGHDFSCFNSLVSRIGNRDALVLAYLDNGYCRRHGVCESTEILHKIPPKRLNRLLEKKRKGILKAYRIKLQSLLRRITPLPPRINLVVMLGLEDNFSEKAAKNLHQALSKIKGNFLLGRNPLGDGSSIRVSRDHNRILELHDKNPKFRGDTVRIYNFDGRDVSVREVKKFIQTNKELFAIFLWRPHWQTPGVFPIKERTFVFNVEDVNYVRRIYGHSTAR